MSLIFRFFSPILPTRKLSKVESIVAYFFFFNLTLTFARPKTQQFFALFTRLYKNFFRITLHLFLTILTILINKLEKVDSKFGSYF